MTLIIIYLVILLFAQLTLMGLYLITSSDRVLFVLLTIVNFIPFINIMTGFILILWFLVEIGNYKDNNRKINILCLPSGEVIKIKNEKRYDSHIKWSGKYKLYTVNDKNRSKVQ